MKRTMFVCITLLLGGGLASGAHAQVCLDFSAFVDGLEVIVAGDRITGYWRNWDGEGGDAPIVGLIRDSLPLPCNPGNPAKAGIVCLEEFGCDTVPGWENYFLLDGLDSTMQAGLDINDRLGPPGACVYEELHYQVLQGPCPFKPQGNGPTLMSVIRERLQNQGALREELP